MACEQLLCGVLGAGDGRTREFAVMSKEFESLHRKSWCKMLIGGDKFGDDVILRN